MAFFDFLTGAGSRRDIEGASVKSQAELQAGRDRALASLKGGLEPSQVAINAGYDQARGDINSGVAGATGAIQTGYDRARGDITDLYGRAEGALTDSYDRTKGILDPLIGLGQKYDTSYADATGVNGAGARTGWFDQNVRDNADFGYADDLAAKQLEAKLNAQGISGGRAAALQERQGSARIEDRTNSLLDRIKTAGDRGAGFAGQLAGFSQQTGAGVAGLRSGQGDRLAGLETGRGGSIADLTFKGGTALADNATNRGSALAGLGASSAKSIADLEYGYGQQTAANTINTGNAIGATRNTLANNLIGIAGLAVGANTPGRNGTTPWQNIWGKR